MIWVGDIGNRFLRKLLSTEEHRLVLSSGGGCCDAMSAAIDLMAGGDWEVLVTGACMSAAVPILACGARRTATKNTRFLVHPGSYAAGTESAENLRISAREQARYDRLYLATLARFTHKPYHWWREKASHEFYFSAAEAKRWGLIDGVE